MFINIKVIKKPVFKHKKSPNQLLIGAFFEFGGDGEIRTLEGL